MSRILAEGHGGFVVFVVVFEDGIRFGEEKVIGHVISL